MDFILLSGFWHGVLRSTTPVLFATLAVMITSKCGITNLAVEGAMLVAALMGVLGSAYFNSLATGAILAIFFGVFMIWVLGFFTFKLKANVIITGIALNLFAAGGTQFLLVSLTGDKSISSSLKSKVFPSVDIPIIENIPFIGDVISGQNLLTYVALIMVVVLYLLLYKTSLGIKIRAVGEMESAAKSVGIKENRVKFIALTISGVLASLGGMFLSMGYLSMFTANMTAGRGYISLATSAMANAHPVAGFFSSLIYGFIDSVAIYMQKSHIPLEFIQMLPYVFIIVVFVGFSYIKKLKLKDESDF